MHGNCEDKIKLTCRGSMCNYKNYLPNILNESWSSNKFKHEDNGFHFKRTICEELYSLDFLWPCCKAQPFIIDSNAKKCMQKVKKILGAWWLEGCSLVGDNFVFPSH